MNFRREDLECGFESDSCFYVKNADVMHDNDEVDLSQDPPPDLIIEIDITRPRLPRFSIFAAIGFTEVWRYDGVRVEIFKLVSGNYHGRRERGVAEGDGQGSDALHARERNREAHRLVATGAGVGART